MRVQPMDWIWRWTTPHPPMQSRNKAQTSLILRQWHVAHWSLCSGKILPRHVTDHESVSVANHDISSLIFNSIKLLTKFQRGKINFNKLKFQENYLTLLFLGGQCHKLTWRRWDLWWLWQSRRFGFAYGEKFLYLYSLWFNLKEAQSSEDEEGPEDSSTVHHECLCKNVEQFIA